MSWVTIYSALMPADAQVVRSYLEASGLAVNVVGELAALSTDCYSLGTGGIQVQVPEASVQEARDLLAKRESPGA